MAVGQGVPTLDAMSTRHEGQAHVTKRERRVNARAHRRAVEAAQHRADAARRASRRLAAVAAVALVLTAALIAVTEATLPSGDTAAVPPAQTQELFAGIPSDGYALGDPTAPVTLVEFIDLQCPFCARFDRDVLPTLVRDYVRTGKVRLELRTMAFIGPDSVRAAGAVAGAAEQDRAWGFVDRFMHMQSEENSGYVSEDFLRDVAGGVPGLDAGRALASTAGGQAIARADREASAAGIASTPSFLVGRTGGALRPLQVESLETGRFTAALDEALR
jgi:protein-disulfide isomerase